MITLRDTTYTISTLRNQRFRKAQAVLKKAINILVRKYHVSKVVLIGSLLDKNRFGFHSDIDLCVEGLSDELYFKAIGELLLETDEFDVDIIPFENVSPDMKDRIEKGQILYEKK
jgi:predicted nucleotidyltransferase